MVFLPLKLVCLGNVEGEILLQPLHLLLKILILLIALTGLSLQVRVGQHEVLINPGKLIHSLHGILCHNLLWVLCALVFQLLGDTFEVGLSVLVLSGK